MKVRKAKKEDVKQLSVLRLNLFNKWNRLDPIDKINKKWFGSKKDYAYLRKLISNKDYLVLVAEDGGRLIAYSLSQVLVRQPFLENAGYLAEGYVSPRYRKKGIMKIMIKKRFKWFKKKKLSWIIVGTHSLDKEAISFWKHVGFKEFNKFFKLKI